ncbi:MAG: EVE domain-containing protein [Vicinamibacterales bacterium]
MAANPADRRYWLIKSEPGTFSFDDLVARQNGTTGWDGVRNYQARNHMRDGMKKGDLVFFYHSSSDPAQIVGVAQVAREAYPDPTALDPNHDHFDPKSKADAPAWMQVDVKAVEKLKRPLPLTELRQTKGLEKMVLLQKGSRLSVQPVSPAEWDIIYKLGMGKK